MTYSGKTGPADAMSALDDEFQAAYKKAADAMLAAILDFERANGRVVDSINLETLDINTLGSARHLRHARLHFLPRPDEVAW